MRIEVKCPICRFTDFKKKLIVKDHFLTQEYFNLDECMNCGLIFTNPKPSQKNLAKYYQSEEYISHNTTKPNVFSFIYRTVRSYGFKSKLKLIKKYATKANLLDIGCGTGEFLNHLNNNGYNVIGIEPNSSARNFAKNLFHLDIFNEEHLLQFKKKSFDVITMWHVLEHVDDLNERLQIIKELLAPNGTLIIAVPNPNSFDAFYYKEFWAAWDVPRHLYHFRKETLEKLLSNFNFEIVDIKPMIFDAFYISLLSEKYKNKKSNYIKAIRSGLTSNRKAKEHKFGYSSQIYVAKQQDSN